MVVAEMSRRPAALTKAQVEATPLLTALQFISVAQLDVGELYQTHCIINNGWLKAFDGMLTVAAKITEDISACPHTLTFKEAIAKAGPNFTIVQLAADKLAVRGGNGFRAFVPCLADPQALPNVSADTLLAPLSGEIVKALQAVQPIIRDKGDRVVDRALLLRRGSAVACDGFIAIEYWHGHDMPPLAIPKAAALALIRCGKEPIGFGFGRASATFYFADESWIRTQLYIDPPYPIEVVDGVLNSPSNPWPLPAGLFEAIRSIEKFSDNNAVYFAGNNVRSHMRDGIGATYELSGIPNNVAYNMKLLFLAEPYMQRVDLQGRNGIGYFFAGDRIRGSICQILM